MLVTVCVLAFICVSVFCFVERTRPASGLTNPSGGRTPTSKYGEKNVTETKTEQANV